MSDKPAPEATRDRKGRRGRSFARFALVSICLYLFIAYLALPALWRHYERRPAMADAPKTTRTAQGIPGDALNLGLVGAEEQLVRAMLDAGWRPADPITVRSSLRIAASVVFDRPDPDAPVSNLFLFDRKQDLAFEKPVGKNASRRHHVRFWKTPEPDQTGEPMWLGAVTYDERVGLSHRTGQITHHIGPDIDAERDLVIEELSSAGWLTETFDVTGVGATINGRNGGGDRYFTDGELTIGVLAAHRDPALRPKQGENPTPVRLKEDLWSYVRAVMPNNPSAGEE